MKGCKTQFQYCEYTCLRGPKPACIQPQKKARGLKSLNTGTREIQLPKQQKIKALISLLGSAADLHFIYCICKKQIFQDMAETKLVEKTVQFKYEFNRN